VDALEQYSVGVGTRLAYTCILLYYLIGEGRRIGR
jgi:hypothetical protein